MAQKIAVQMPQDLDLVAGWTIRVTAVDSTGAVVSAVKVSNLAIIADQAVPQTAGETAQLGPFMLVPGPGA